MVWSFPLLMLAERDRRWGLVREFLKAKNLDALLVLGMKGREPFEAYLANENSDGGVLFPAVGDPIQLTWATHRVTRRFGRNGAAQASWIADMRPGRYSDITIAAIKERKLTEARIGVVGLDSKTAAEPQGVIPYMTWSHILEELPRIEFVEVSRDFALLMLPKSPEEIALIERACEIAEKACHRLLEVAKVGVSESELYATVMYEIYKEGSSTVDPRLNLFVGPDELGWGPPLWTQASWKPPIVQPGDVIQAEIFSAFGGLETQSQMTIAIEPVHSEHAELAEVAAAAYQAGVAAMRPGNTFGDVCEAMVGPLNNAGCWHGPVIHSLAPLVLVSGRHRGLTAEERDHPKAGNMSPHIGADVPLATGMVFAMEPDACRGLRRVDLGATVIMTETGAREMNTITNTMHRVS